MKEPNIFSVAIRIFGLAFLYHGAINVPLVFGPQFSFGGLLGVAWSVAAAWYLLRGGPFLQALAYPESATSFETKEEDRDAA